MEDTVVLGLVLPGQLTSLLRQGRWRHPGDAEMARLAPWFEDPLDFLANTEQMTKESGSMDRFADDARSSALFRGMRGSSQQAAVKLPWLDVRDPQAGSMPPASGPTSWVPAASGPPGS